MSFRASVALLDKHHDRAAFRCGVESLDQYLHQQAGQDIRRNAASVYVLEGADGKTIRGFYTLSAYGVRVEDFPAELRGQLPRYDLLPAYLLGRLAVDEAHRGQNLGRLLLVDALMRCVRMSKPIAALAVVVDAIDEKAAAFYRHHNFQPCADQPLKLFIPMKRLAQMMPPDDARH